MAIRAAIHDDAAELLPLYRAYCDFYNSSPSDEALQAMIREVIDEPDDRAYLLVAEEDGQVAGFACCIWTWSSLNGGRAVVLADLYVREASRGRGHADALILVGADVARERGAVVLSWFTGPDNKRAHAVYDRVGGVAEPLLEYELEL